MKPWDFDVCAIQSHRVREVILSDSVAGTISRNFALVDSS